MCCDWENSIIYQPGQRPVGTNDYFCSARSGFGILFLSIRMIQQSGGGKSSSQCLLILSFRHFSPLLQQHYIIFTTSSISRLDGQVLSQEKIAFPGILKYFSSCLGDSTDVLLVDFISEMDTTMIHLESQKADLNLRTHFSNTAHDQMSCVQARNLFIYNAASGGFQVC